MGQIYLIQNLINKKVYVGQTANTFDVRYGPNGIKDVLRYSHNEYLKNAIRKYGFDNFKITILVDNVEESLLDELEIKYIEEYKATIRDKGYNMRTGGSRGRPNAELLEKMRTKVICVNTQETFESQSEAGEKYGVACSTIGACCKGLRGFSGRDPISNEPLQWAYFKGWDTQYELKDIRVIRNDFKQVICINTGEIFLSGSDAIRAYKMKRSHLYDCVWGLRPTAGTHPTTRERLQWAYYDPEESYELQDYKLAKKPVICINTQEIFESGAAAAEFYNIANANLNASIQGKQKTCGIHPTTRERLQWDYFDPSKEYTLGVIVNENQKKIICLNTLEIYNSITETCEKLNVSRGQLQKACAGKIKSTKNLCFAYYDENKEYEKVVRPIKSRTANSGSFASRKVLCIETNEVFESLSSASKKVSIGVCGISDCCKGRQRTAGGYHWRYID